MKESIPGNVFLFHFQSSGSGNKFSKTCFEGKGKGKFFSLYGEN